MKLEELARRAVACKHWRWMPGMRSKGGPGTIAARMVRRVDLKLVGAVWIFEDGFVHLAHGAPPVGWAPDFSDPATLGCLLHLVREAWGEPTLCVREINGAWITDAGIGHGDTEAEALVAALEAAP